MIEFKLIVTTKKNVICEFEIRDLKKTAVVNKTGVCVGLADGFPYKIKITPPKNDELKTISYTVSTNLKNFHQVIVPDTGRTYPSQMQLVDFWGKKWLSRVNNIRIPLFILTGADLYTDFIFGLIGPNIETDFIVREPAIGRALSAWTKRFTLTIQRGTDVYPIPGFVCDKSDGSITEYIYFKEGAEINEKETWISSLREFSLTMAGILKSESVTTDDTLLPFWCSWTDWYSDDVTEDVILENVREGVELGIKNFIIDDGWFGPGLDSDFNINLNIGDWREDKSKIKNLKLLVDKIHAEDANAIIWCAPHAVAPHAECFGKREKYLIQNKKDILMMTNNKFHSLCFMCQQAREVMADICADLIRDYGVDGAKYDLFNCVPDEPCVSNEHRHDTTSMIDGLTKTLELIDRKTRSLNKNYIIELKQNYATPYLYQYGTCIRAGDTPYNPEGNFLRTAYVNAYTPYSLNDYQTITNSDSPAEATVMIIKMMAVGIPSYSINFAVLNPQHKRAIKFYHTWYKQNIDNFRNFRVPLDPCLCSWLVPGKDKNIYFLVNNENRLNISEIKNAEILNATSCGNLYLSFPQKVSVDLIISNFDTPNRLEKSYDNITFLDIDSKAGDIINISQRLAYPQQKS
ncbi:MAG: alpha-galactosidase [Phycisphaerae bacterium]|nr:alpha-galactosidase [Phycisphaerae bacterium]